MNSTDIEILAAKLSSRSYIVVVMEMFLLALVILITIAGNLSVLAIVYRTPSLRTITNLFVASLAVSDLIMPVLCSSLSLGVLIVGRWPFGEVMCQLQSFSVLVLACASLQTMAVTAVNRYFCIVRPVYYRRIFTARRTQLMIAAVWVVACTESLPYLISGNRYVFHPGKFFCFQGKKISFPSLLVYAYVGIPMTAITFCYFKVFQTLRRHKRSIMASLKGGNTAPNGPRVPVEEIKATKTLFLTVVGFLAVWTPIVVVDFIDFANGHWVLPRQVYVMYAFMGTLSSTINPCIYGVMNKAFRSEYRKLLKLGEVDNGSRSISLVNSNTKKRKIFPVHVTA